MIIKIMTANRGNDDHPRHAYKMFSDVQEVEFTEPKNGYGPRVHLIFSYDKDGEEVTTLHLEGNVYVMNDAGKTISKFEIDPNWNNEFATRV